MSTPVRQLVRPAPPVLASAPTDSGLCVRGANIWLRHQWGVASGRCVRCNEPLYPEKTATI